ncbi:MAG: hypothetical protein ACTHOD_21750 [Motilibacteraceae bacterium]
MLWPVLVVPWALDRLWRPGDEVTVTLDWRDAGEGFDELGLREVELEVAPLPVPEGWPAWQLLSSGGFRAVRRVEDGQAFGRHRFSGLAAYEPLAAHDPATTGVVRRLQVVHRLHARLEDSWRRVPGALRVVDVEEAAPALLSEYPPLRRHPPSEESPPGPLRFMTEQQYLREAGHRLPRQQWRAVGFLAQLEVAD